MTKLRPVFIASLAPLLFASSAFAQSVSTRPELSVGQIESRLSERGYRVLEIERDDGRFEVTAFDNAGACVELDVDRRTGEVIRSKRDDDCGVSRSSSGHAR